MNRFTLLSAAWMLGGCAARSGPAPDLAAVCPVPMPVMPSVFPRPSYPQQEAENGYEDKCTVRFDVDAPGAPVNPAARCTCKAFAESVEAAMLDARFDPALSRTLPAGTRCASFNFEYSIEPPPRGPWPA